MKSPGIKSLFIKTVIVAGIALNSFYGMDLLPAFLSGQDTAGRDVFISAISLEWGWALLLCWVLLKPFSRYLILLITAVAMLSANILHDIELLYFGNTDIVTVALNFTTGCIMAGLFFLAWFAARSEKIKTQGG